MTLRRFIRNIRIGLANLRYYAPVIWNDRPWDHTHILRLLDRKFQQVEEAEILPRKERHNLHVARLLIARLLADNYGDFVFARHDEKWGEPVMKTYEDPVCGMRISITRSNVTTPEQERQQRREFRACYEHEAYMEKQDVAALFDLLRRHLFNWWD